MSLPVVNPDLSSSTANLPTFLSHELPNFSSIPQYPQALDLSLEARVTDNQIPIGMETEVIDSDADVNKSSYEIAVEALCLMKSGGLVSLDDKRDRNAEESVKTKAHYNNIHANRAEAMLTNSNTEIQFEDTCFARKDKPDVNVPTPEIVQTSSYLTRSIPQADVNGSHVVMNVNIGQTGSCVSQNGLLSTAVLQTSSSSFDASSQPVKYVIMPESTLLSMVKPGEIVSLPETPYYFMMQKEKQPTTKVISIPGLQNLNQNNNLPDGGPSVFNVSNNTVFSPMNYSKSAISIEKPTLNDGTSQSVSLNTKSTTGKRSAMKKHDTLKFPPCIICDGEASGFHYGCNTCEACKNFFRRCLLRKSDMPFICHSGKTCEISFKKNKNNCSSCRLDKCLELGMAKEKCKMGRYTALMRTETIKKVRRLEGKDDDNSETSSLDSPCPGSNQNDETCSSSETQSPLDQTESVDICADVISKHIYTAQKGPPANDNKTEYNEKLVQYLVSAMENIKPWGENLVTEEARKALANAHYEKYKSRVEAFGSLKNVPMQEYQELLKKFGIDLDGQWDLLKKCSFDWESIVSQYCSFAKCIPEFQCLSYDDQACLLKATHFDFYTIVLHQGYFPEYGVFLEINGAPYHIEEAANKFFTREFVFLMVDMMGRLQKLNLSKSEMALLISIVTMSSDQCNLENSKLVEDTQLRLVELLLKELCKVYGQSAGSKRLTNFIDVITRMRDISNIYFKEYRSLCKNDFIKESVPNLEIMIPEEH
ncbi:nuclear receptor ROR-alpha B-like [Ruditapes philippinarum]|uniref:nuclear receptor ROR-alpha B-like n=1 Tax=Ruditapes philippinarum TaxID=129788 RepID=UPI00295A5D7D|nr:nuclear receptor ROR-alpha B-like [Ruditapes philippinarum]